MIFSARILLPRPASSSHVGVCLSRFVGPSSQHGLFPPVGHSGSSQKHVFFYILREDDSHVHRFLSFKHQGVPLWPLDAQVTGLAHNGSCRSSHLPPRLNLKKLLPPTLPSALMPIFPSQIPLSKPTWPILPPLPKYSLPCNVRATPIPSHLLLLSFVLLNLSLSVGAMPTAWHPHSQGPKPAPNNFLTRIPM